MWLQESKEADLEPETAAKSPTSGGAGAGGGASGPAYGSAGLSMLAGLIGGAGTGGSSAASAPFRLNLFPDQDTSRLAPHNGMKIDGLMQSVVAPFDLRSLFWVSVLTSHV